MQSSIISVQVQSDLIGIALRFNVKLGQMQTSLTAKMEAKCIKNKIKNENFNFLELGSHEGKGIAAFYHFFLNAKHAVILLVLRDLHLFRKILIDLLLKLTEHRSFYHYQQSNNE